MHRGPGWIDPCMRLGYAARGVVYGLVGVFALLAAWRGGEAEGPKGALASLVGETGGTIALLVVGTGLLAYALWRLLDAILDLDAYGEDAEGVVARAGMVATALTHIALGVYALTLIRFIGGSGGGGGAESGVHRLLSWPFGRWIVIGVGLCIVGAGGYYIFGKAIGERYKREIVSSEASRRLEPALKAGMMVYGLVLGVIGGLVVWAGWTYDASEAGGFAQALRELRSWPFGRWILGGVGVGLLLFALTCFVYARQRILPGVAQSGASTLAGSVRDVAGRARLPR